MQIQTPLVSRFPAFRIALRALVVAVLAHVLVVAACFAEVWRQAEAGWTYVGVTPDEDDLAWWKASVGPVPPVDDVTSILTPMPYLGRFTEVWKVPPTGRPPAFMEAGFIAWQLDPSHPALEGKLYAGLDDWHWWLTTGSPFGSALVFSYTGVPGSQPPSILSGAWTVGVRGLSFGLHLIIGGALIILAGSAWRWLRTAWQQADGRIVDDREPGTVTCGRCHHRVGCVDRCPECGWLGTYLGESAFRPTLPWAVALMASGVAGLGFGLLRFLVIVLSDGLGGLVDVLQIGGLLWGLWELTVMATAVLPLLLYLGRRRLVRFGTRLQWIIASVPLGVVLIEYWSILRHVI